MENCRTEESWAKAAMQLAGIEHATIVKGWFETTLIETPPTSEIALLRLDADWYSSTAQCLNNLWPRVAVGGIVILDDYFAWDGCAKALHRYLSSNQLSERIETVGDHFAFIRKRDAKKTVNIDPFPQGLGCIDC